jgi:hypothetical protein
MEQPSLNFDPPSLAPECAAVLSCLRHGRQAATSSTEIERRTGLTVRKIQQVIRDLRLKHKYRISANTKDPKGYYINEKQEDTVVMLKAWRRRAFKVLTLCAEFNKSCVRMEFEQSCIEMEKEGEGGQS